MREKVKQIVTLVATFAGVLGPSLSSFSPGSSTTGEISGRFFQDVFIIPADYAFAIWAPIYLGFLAFAIFQALPAQRFNPRFMRVRLWLVASALLNAAWIAAFNNLLFGLSLVVIVGMLVTALVMHQMLEIGKTKVYGLERVLRLSFSLYAGWLTAATILNTAGVLTVNNWGGFGISYPVWGVIMLFIATAIGLTHPFPLERSHVRRSIRVGIYRHCGSAPRSISYCDYCRCSRSRFCGVVADAYRSCLIGRAS